MNGCEVLKKGQNLALYTSNTASVEDQYKNKRHHEGNRHDHSVVLTRRALGRYLNEYLEEEI